MHKFFAAFVLALGLLPVLAACGGSTAPTPVSVVLDWFPWSNHAGLFIAKDRGYFAAEGLDVDIHPPADPSTVLQTVATGRDDFGINYQTGVLIARQEGVPVVSIAAIVQHPLNSVMSLKGSGITEPKDLAGKTVGWPGIPDNEFLLATMLKSQGKSLDDVELVNVGFDLVPALIGKKVDAIVGAYWVHESISAINQGFPVNIMRMEDWGIPDFYEIVMVASEDMVNEAYDSSLDESATAQIENSEQKLFSLAEDGGAEGGFTYVSMAGGAFLEWMEGRALPGVEALKT